MILKNCRVVPELCEGVPESMVDIRIDGDTISEFLSAGGSYPGEEVIDCTGKTVLPGLFNLHNHLFFSTNDWDKIRGRQSEYRHITNCVKYMQELLSYGFTSLRDVGSPYNIAIKLRDQINAGTMVGPDIKACGIIITPDQIAPPDLEVYSANPMKTPANDPYLLRGIARRPLAEGADFLKILGSSVLPCGRGDGPLFYTDELEELVNVAKREGTYIAVHTTSPEANQAALDYEMYTIEHCLFWSKENNDSWLAHGKKSQLIPTLQICAVYGGEEAARMQCESLMMAYEAGAMFGWGTDATEELYMSQPAEEFLLRSKIWGIPNVEILKQATINSAIINGTADQRGSIKVGKKADFAIIDGKPDQDLTLFGKPCAYVLKDGVVVACNGFVKA